MWVSCDPRVSLHCLLLKVRDKLLHVAGLRPWSLESASAVYCSSRAACLSCFKNQGRELLFVSESVTVRPVLFLIKERTIRNMGPKAQKSLSRGKSSSERQDQPVTDKP